MYVKYLSGNQNKGLGSQNTKDKIGNLKSILEPIFITDKQDEIKRLLSDLRIKIENIIQSTDINVLHEYFDDEYPLFRFGNFENSECLFCLVAYHVLIASEKENSTHILNNMPRILQGQRLHRKTLYSPVQNTLFLYLDMYYKDTPNENFSNIHDIWKSDPATEIELKLVYCLKLMEAKDFKTLIQLINHHVDYFIESFKNIVFGMCENPRTPIMVYLHILLHQMSLTKIKKVKIVEAILSRLINNSNCPNRHVFIDGFYDFISTLDNKQILCFPHLIKLLQPAMKQNPCESLNIIVLCSNRLMQSNHHKECIEFIKYHSQFLLSSHAVGLTELQECYTKQQYCITLLLLLDEYVSCRDTHHMNLVLMRLLQFRLSLLSKVYKDCCYCFMGNQHCLPYTGNETKPPLESFFDSLMDDTFQQTFLDQYSKVSFLNEHNSFTIDDFDSVMENVACGKRELAPYLQSMIDMMKKKETKVKSLTFFVEFIKRSTDHDAATLFNIINTVSALDLQPVTEIQDMVLHGLTEYLIHSCNGKHGLLYKKHGLLYKFILDINMVCPKGQFLQLLTSDVAKLLLKLEDDTVKDVKMLVYHCYCNIRHDSKNIKNANIAKYKDHYTFITSMEIKEEMKKMTTSTNFLLMLTILHIASGGHHKSAELKKYLSLKYEYRDSILYLLWCSGDVEINPGPTLSTLRKVPDSVKERNWLYEMCSILLRLLKYRSIDLKNDGLWKEKPLNWPNGWPFYDPRNKPKGQGYNTGTDKKLMECLEEHCHHEGLLNKSSKFDEKHTKSKVRQYKMEITAWKNNRTELFELYTLRQELNTLRAAKKSLHQYKNERELQEDRSDLNIHFKFGTDDVTSFSCEGYTDIVRDIAITFCRIGKGLSPLEKSDGIWKTPPSGWNPNHSYFSPCNAGKRKEKGQYQKLVDNLLTYCESKKVTIPSELQPLLKAWKQRSTSEITKRYTIWSKTAIIKHSLQYLQLEGILEKIHVQESLEEIGLILDTQHWRCPSVNTSCTSDNDDKSQNPGFSDNLPSSSNSAAKITSIQINSDNPSTQLSNSTQTNTNDTPASPHSLDCHTDGHLCNVAPDQQHHRNQSSKHTCVNSFKDRSPILTSKEQPEADGNPQPISSVNSSTWKGEVIPCTVHIHDATSKTDSNNKISKTAKKRGKQKNDESPSEPKQLHISEEDVPLLLNILTSPSQNGMVLTNTRQKNCSKDGDIRTISPNRFPHDLISIQSRLNSSAVKNQTDQLVVKDLTDSASDKPEDSSIYNRKDGMINKANKNKTISDKYVDKIVDLLEELNQDYSSTLVEKTIPMACSSTDQSEDLSNELPEPFKLCVDTYLNSYNPDDTLETDIEQFIEELGMDSS